MKCGLNNFISDESIDLHRKHLENLKLKYSILEKSIPEIKNTDIRLLNKLRVKRYKNEALKMKCDIMCHDMYFSSFGEEYQSSETVKKSYRTEASFLYEIFETAKEWDSGGFILICVEKGCVFTHIGENAVDVFTRSNPVLAIDLCEHAYFLDYGFNKSLYLENALKRLNLNKLDKFL